MPKIAALHGISNIYSKHKPPGHATPRKRAHKREHAWVDVSDDDLEVKSSKKLSSKGTNKSDHGPRKKARLSAPPGPSFKESLHQQRKQLPIYSGKDAVVDMIRENDVTVLIGETGSGKTTQVPQYLLEAGLSGSGMIAITQPRKVAATSLASRVASEQSTSVGSLVGYSVRFDEACSSDTRIKYVTDGMLVRELLGDPLLSRYSVVIVDEAHERTLRTDLLLANLKTLLRTRNAPTSAVREGAKGKGKGKERASEKLNPLKVVIMSATLEAEKFSKFFGGAQVVYVKGRQHPVTIYHTKTSQPDYVDAAFRTFFQIHTDRPSGDVLIFLPGQEDIESLEKSIQLYANQLPKDASGVLVCPMYAALPPSQQTKIFSPTPAGMRKCILATNIAETSITIPGVKYVIDTGKCKEKRYLAKHTGTGFDTLLTRDITQSSAVQRAGRAGREGKGFCFRLYTEEAFNALPITAEPEILRCTLTSSVLQLRCLSQNLEELDLMDTPEESSIAFALIALVLLGALDNRRSLTPLGRKMAAFPLEPPLARALLAAPELGCTSEVLAIVSVLSSSSSLFVNSHDARDAAADARRKFRHPSGDHLTILNVVRAYEDVAGAESKAGRRDWCRKMFLNERCLAEAVNIRAQLRDVCERQQIDWRVGVGDSQGAESAILRAMVQGLVQNTAFLQPDGSYKQVMGHTILKIHPSSSLVDKKVPAIIYDELVYTTHIYARGVSAVPRNFIAEVPLLKQRTR
ncbi:P-loop containing nucleoside triphosphate hydrolase protein [Dichomitus squalens]|uniref:RNA helicase n=1 Tax=Dichomitus squalens TaxID=114155 RepID=A0A4Q9MHV1_9APHY|nr:P-loop containing nucleoside triphosphate hydrolase protein [Dichomitus squalens]